MYTVFEEPVEYYIITVEGNTKDGFTITNQYLPQSDGEAPPPPGLPDTGDNVLGVLMAMMLSVLGGVLCFQEWKKRKLQA